MSEKHGSVWREPPEWRVVYERYDRATDLLAIVMKHDGLNLAKAALFTRFENGLWPRAVWDPVGAVEAIFGPDDIAEAANYVESVLRNLYGSTDTPAD